VELVPSGRAVRIRGLQTHRKRLQTAVPGTRVAVNIAGVSHNEIERGEVVTAPGWLTSTGMIDVKVQVLKEAPRPLRHNTGVVFYAYTSECEARVRLLEARELRPGEAGWAQVHLSKPVPLVKDDLFVLRSPETTIGGGRVLDAHPRRHRRGHQPTLERLKALEEGTLSEALLRALEAESPLTVGQLSRRVNVTIEEVEKGLEEMRQARAVVVLTGSGADDETVAYSSAAWTRLKGETRTFLETYHRKHPLRRGAPREEVRSRLRLSPQLFSLVLERMKEDGVVSEEEALLRLSTHSISLSQAQRREMEAYLKSLEREPYSPPTDRKIDPELLSYLVDEEKVVKVDDTVVFLAEAYQDMVQRVVQLIRERGRVTVAEVRDFLDTSRKYIMPLLLYMDRQRITRRVGDERVLR